jgi:hypothetical protein
MINKQLIDQLEKLLRFSIDQLEIATVLGKSTFSYIVCWKRAYE